ncbi:RelA/SpoT family protein [Calditerrivibrio nitroreducens]|uniref:(P)ppGpp synthetase I, SpoT/RelA n=1 Tax=Calditerrivibrio nitroreducens (strain DSM 19672 / NBRC 101217 / Yu37-1) TaxID=768670 RepID=E4TG25_CALNY|nr:bifunctional (p)ppGpp synthetase/guanosine-3',5'-bis(diphosphate) 3'-pyrophosphohydrolase [Calditerrivibrio nitroreducens]ADR18575.1 (p)ppGpp synthetase I, SpoT/RelA [Calditerrivibrio nitroreducens DSM 19672]
MAKDKIVRLMDIQEVLQKNNITNIEKIHKAYVYAAQKHRGQLRKSGEPYLSHPLNVALILANMNMDLDTVTAGILHDTLEDTDATYEELAELFGEDVAFLVDGVSKIGKISFKSSEEKMAENFRKMLISMSKDVRVIVIKLADRLHNMRTLDYLSEEKKQRIAKETMEIYAPLAHRLGIAWIKWELEDLSFRILNPDKYYEIYNLVKLKRSEREAYLNQVINLLDAHLKNVNIQAEVTGRPKHFYSIYSKMIKKKTSFDEIYDLLAVRVIVKTVSDCYATLGIIHNLWKPIPGRFKDYIAMPKANMYQSLHTTVVGPNGLNVEIQIRTEEMHRIAEEGIAAHWKYKEGKVFNPKDDTTFVWLRQLLEQKELNKPQDLVEALKEDILPRQIYIFTPKGDVIELPEGSTPIDFAYAIHSKVGEKCVGAKVDGKMVNLKYKLKNGEKVEIVTSPTQEPRSDWLNIVKTNRAKIRIRNYLRKKEEDLAIKTGQELLAKEFELRGLSFTNIIEDEKKLRSIIDKFSLKNLEDLYKSVGFGRISPKQVANLFHKPDEKDDELLTKPSSPKSSPFNIEGVGDILTTIAKCCHPLPGDNLKGYISVGKGLIVHRADCPNLIELSKANEDRIIDVNWAEGKNIKLPFKITTVTIDKPGILSDITTLLKDMAINIIELSAKPQKDGNARQTFTIELSGKSQLDKVLQKLQSLPYLKEIIY